MTDEQKLYQLIKTGSLENIELALSIAKSNGIKLDYEAAYQCLWERQNLWKHEFQYIQNHEEQLIPQITQLLSITFLRLYPQDLEEKSVLLKNLVLLHHLSKLRLRNINLTTLPPEICEIEQLVTLDLTQNFLTQLPDCFSKMKKLERIYLTKNQLETVPKAIFQCTQLEYLNLSQNKINDLDGDWQKLENLKQVHLNENQLNSLPDNICNLKDLEVLHLDNNNIKKLPQNFYTLSKLRGVTVDNNGLEELSADIANIKKAMVINLKGNALERLPDTVFDLPNLSWLDVRNNPFSSNEKERIKKMAMKASLSLKIEDSDD